MAKHRSIRDARSRAVALSTAIALLFGLGFSAVGAAAATEAPTDTVATAEPTDGTTATTDAPAPTDAPSEEPTDSAAPTTEPRTEPTAAATTEPRTEPTAEPSTDPSVEPSAEPTATTTPAPEPLATEAPSPDARTVETLAAPAAGTATISGRLVDSVTKEPLAGLSVRLLPASGEGNYGQPDPFATATTDAAGAFKFSVTEANGYLVEVANDALGYVRVDSNIVSVALGQNYYFDDTPVVRGAILSGALNPPAGLRGVLTGYVTAQPVSGSSYGSGTSSVPVEMTAGSTTDWTLAVLPGTYDVQLSASQSNTRELWWNSAGNVGSRSAAEAIVAAVGDTIKDIDGTLSFGDHTISGTVRDDQGNPLADVNVSARPESPFGTSPSAVTGADGTYTLGNLNAGEFVVQFSPGWGTGIAEFYDNAATIADATTLAFTTGVTHAHENINATIDRGNSISGTVDVSSNFTGLISVKAESLDGSVTQYTSTSNGRYTIHDLPAGSYTVEFTAGSVTEYFDNVDTKAEATVLHLPTNDGRDLAGIDATITVAMISGTVASAPGTYLQVEILSLDGKERIATAFVNNGTYSVTLKPGTYTARVLENYTITQYYDGVFSLADATPIVVADGETTIADFGLVGGTISGTVTSAASVAGTVAMLFRAHDTLNSIRTVTLDETGAYSFVGLTPNNYMIKIASGDTLFAERWFGPSGKQTDATAIDLKANAEYNTADVVIAEGGGIRGTITLPTNSNSVYLYVYSAEDKALLTIYPSSIAGSSQRTWSTAGLPAGDYRIQLQASGSSTWWQSGTSFDTATPIKVSAGSWTENVDFAPGVSISGTVTSALNGSAITIGTVQASRVGETYGWYYAYLGIDGSYAFIDLPDGDYNLKFDGYSYANNYRQIALHTQWYSGATDLASATSVTVIDGVPKSDIDAAMQPGIAISGTITDAATGAPVANASVSGWSGSGANTDANGHYEATMSAPGATQLVVSTSAYVRSETVIDVPAEGLTNADVQLVAGTVISGTVTAANNGVPLSNVTVYISTDQQNGWSSNQTSTDFNGNFTSQPLLPGSYYVRYQNGQGQYVTQWFANAATGAQSAAVAVGVDPVTDIDAQLTLGGAIVGTITGSDGKPIAGAKIGLATAPTEAFARFSARLFGAATTTGGELLGIETFTRADGTYTMPPVEPGRYVLYVYDQNHKTTWYNGKSTLADADVITVEAGQTRTVSETVAPLAENETALEPEQTISNNFAVTQQPTDQSIESGYNATFTAFASGDPLPTIQWQTDATGEWADLFWQTSTSLNVTAPAYGDPAVNYRAVFTQNDQTHTSDQAALTVLAPITAPDAPAAPTLSKQTYTGGTISWTAPAINGAAITGYTVKVYDGSTLVRTVPTGVVLTSVISGLTEATDYKVTLTAHNSQGASTESESGTLSTIAFTAPNAPSTPNLAAIDSTQVTATWVASTDDGGTPVTGYTVNLYQGSTLVETKTTDARSLTFTGLTRATAYTVEVSATNAVGSSSASDRSAAATTKATVPDATTAPTLKAASVSKVTASWTAPNNGGADLTGYTVRLFNGSTLVETKTTTAATVTFAGLLRGIAYTADVSASNSIGAGAASAVSAGLTIPVTIPGVPAAPTATAPSSTEIAVAWTAPDDGGTPITRYRVNVYQGTDLVKTDTTDALALTFTGLTRGTAYTAEVSAENAIGSASVSERSAVVSTPTTAPGAPGTLNIGATSATRIAVTWAAPADDGGTPITGYTVKLFQGTELVDTEQAGARDGALTFTGLTRATAYTFEVFAANSVGDGRVSERSVEAATLATVPDKADAPTLVQASVSEITASWTAPSNGGAAITGYDVQLFSGSTLVETKTIETTTVTFAGLTRGIAYTANVSAASTIGSGAASAHSEALTIPLAVPGVPDAPTLTAPSATEIAVAWSTPVDDGGSAITGYRVNLYAGADLVKTATTDARTLTFTFAKLTRATAYTAEVMAVNAIGGDSVSGRSAVVSTPTTIPGIPTSVTLTAPSATEIAVAWRAPTDNGGTAVTSYTVKLFQSSTLVSTKETGDLSFTFSGLTRATAYTVEVFAANSVGAGLASDRSAAATTKATVPDVATAPSLAQASVSKISASWTAPDNGGADLTGYTVRLFNGAALIETKSVKTTTVTFAGLARGIAYTADVAAINSVGTGIASALSAAVTIPATTPDVPAAPTVAALSATEASVTWSVPSGTGGSALIGYTVRAFHGSELIAEQTTDAATTTARFAGLLAATEYTATVQATNAIGSSAYSADSAAVRTLPATPTEDDLSEDIENAIVPDTLELTQSESVTISGLDAGEQYYAWFLSTPIGTSWQTASATGTITVTVPASLVGAHRIAISDAAGDIVGWSTVTIAAATVPAVTPPATKPALTAAIVPAAKALSDTGIDPLPFTLLAGLFIALGAAAMTLGRRRGRAGLVR
ncbi:fibronectin type III domain-containing protein [Cryobacterium sp. Y82]|uniref:fibronectin type III domain-containing protein n=1 Tax=Cryobacterium sp. Y82 TaxID=2045017 RepID=UPI000CE37307|nr:fibronectin type III domain-containing protein [Cryobacterium sp. Y82]